MNIFRFIGPIVSDNNINIEFVSSISKYNFKNNQKDKIFSDRIRILQDENRILTILSKSVLLQIQQALFREFDRLLVAAVTYTPDFKSKIYNRNYCG